MLMICKLAKTCIEAKPCCHDKAHEQTGTCHYPVLCGGDCIPYVPESKPFDGAPDLLAKEQERKIAHVESTIDTKKEPIALTDHAKYCRLSKQPGGLCGCMERYGTGKEAVLRCKAKNITTIINEIAEDWDNCPRLKEQFAVELPKDPLEELIEEFSLRGDLCEASNRREAVNALREFAEKVRALK